MAHWLGPSWLRAIQFEMGLRGIVIVHASPEGTNGIEHRKLGGNVVEAIDLQARYSFFCSEYDDADALTTLCDSKPIGNDERSWRQSWMEETHGVAAAFAA